MLKRTAGLVWNYDLLQIAQAISGSVQSRQRFEFWVFCIRLSSKKQD